MRNLVHITIPVKGRDALETWRKYFNEIPGPCWAGPLVPEERDPSYLDQIPKTSLLGRAVQCGVAECRLSFERNVTILGCPVCN